MVSARSSAGLLLERSGGLWAISTSLMPVIWFDRAASRLTCRAAVMSPAQFARRAPGLATGEESGFTRCASSSVREVVPHAGKGGHPMLRVAVVAHAGMSFGGGLAELREVLAREGCTDPLWYEVVKSRKAPKYARRALTRGAEVIFVWGGDGMVQRCIDAVAGMEAVLAILPAGTANLLAANLHVPAGWCSPRYMREIATRAGMAIAGMRNSHRHSRGHDRSPGSPARYTGSRWRPRARTGRPRSAGAGRGGLRPAGAA